MLPRVYWYNCSMCLVHYLSSILYTRHMRSSAAAVHEAARVTNWTAPFTLAARPGLVGVCQHGAKHPTMAVVAGRESTAHHLQPRLDGKLEASVGDRAALAMNHDALYCCCLHVTSWSASGRMHVKRRAGSMYQHRYFSHYFAYLWVLLSC